MSPMWWRKFASYPFAGVEQLKLQCSRVEDTEIPYLQCLGEEDWKFSMEFRLGGIQISGLRWIEIVNLPDLRRHYPTDFLELVLKNNPRISNHSLKIIATEMSNRYTKRLPGRLSKLVEEQSQKFLRHLQKTFIERKDAFIVDYLVTKKTLPNGRIGDGLFETEMERTVAERMVKDLEEDYAARFAKECAEALRKGSMD